MTSLTKTDRTTMSRLPDRASYDRETANAILDEGLVAHVGFDAGQGTTVIPMTYARDGDCLYLHGAVASRWLSSFREGRDVCISVTLLDGLVLARSAFSHSMNYRSVVAFGTATVVESDEKDRAFKALVDHLLPGRWEDCKQPDEKESAATIVLKVPIAEASIKVRSGSPSDSEKDMHIDAHWTGVIPLTREAGEPIPDPTMKSDRPVPGYVASYRRGGND